ncbi:MAG: alpha/beta hydrolase [Gammaproteobacteria bacterium]|nr:alpha/beta hydrolase [Gammaproteobacteria bacterium]
MRQHDYLSLGPGGFHRVAYTDRGDRACREPLVCVHGLTRNGRDFDALAEALADRRRVVCPDVVGRGRSDWLADKNHYDYGLYTTDMAALLAHLDARRVDWVGTSMGGLIGLLLAATPNSPIRRLVLNDVGPHVPLAALRRIGDYVGADPSFATLDEATAYLKEIQAGFGALDDAQWRHLAEHGTRRDPDGRWRLGHDPGIARAFASVEADVELWPVWHAVRCPVLVMRGADSDVLLPETVERMRAGGPPLTVVEWPGVGHAPALMDGAQIGAIRAWLEETAA